MIVYDRAITPTEISEVQAYLTTKYGLKSLAPPAPPAPAAAQPATVMPTGSLQTGLKAWCVRNQARRLARRLPPAALTHALPLGTAGTRLKATTPPRACG
jgi:hypothetical protein